MSDLSFGGSMEEILRRIAEKKSKTPALPAAWETEEPPDRRVGELMLVMEDIVAALLANHALRITDLSPAAQKFLRLERYRGKSLADLLSDDGGLRLP